MKGREIFVLKMKKINVEDLARRVIKKYAPNQDMQIKFTGSRRGEKLYEELLTEGDSSEVFETNDMFIIVPQKSAFDEVKNDIGDYPNAKKVEIKTYRSDDIT